jgi:hypothetical protein
MPKVGYRFVLWNQASRFCVCCHGTPSNFKNFKHKFFFSNQIPIDPSNVASFSQNLQPFVMFVDLTKVIADLISSKKRKKIYESNRHFQDSWAIKLPWVESVAGIKGKVTQIKCKVGNVNNGKDTKRNLKIND